MISALTAAAGGGLLLALSFPPLDFHLMAWVAFIPLFWAIEVAPGAWQAALCGVLFGTTFFGFDISWVYRTLIMHGHFSPVMAAVVFVAMVLSLALIPGLFGLMLAVLKDRCGLSIIGAPFVWTGLEYVRTWIFTGFPWDLVGYSQASYLPVIQVVDITGIYGVSCLVVLVNGSLWLALRCCFTAEHGSRTFIAVSALVLLTCLGYGYLRLAEFSKGNSHTERFEVGVLQGNIPQEIKWEAAAKEGTFRKYEELGALAVQAGARLLLWPETAAPILFGMHNSEWQRVGTLSSDLGVPMLVGAPSVKRWNGDVNYFNSAFLMEGANLRYRYDKIHLVPFGEYMPLSWVLPLGPGLAAREADYTPGREMTVMRVEGCPPFSVLICYEAIFPELGRLAVNSGAKMLLNITNDGWFGDTGAPYQHLVMAGVRSIENRVWLLRAANTGVSAAFDPSGHMVKSVPLEKEGFLTVSVPSSPSAGSFYSIYGNIFAWTCLALWAALCVAAVRGTRITSSLA